MGTSSETGHASFKTSVKVKIGMRLADNGGQKVTASHSGGEKNACHR
jgi:hypothetical protein